MKKQIMSIAASAALLTIGASAFNTNLEGDILVKDGVKGSYKTDNNSSAGNTLANLTINNINEHGDALIYPYFTQEDGWSSEIYLRNDGDNSIAAKVAIYAGDDSEEVKDFNIYLSANDVFTFKIANNKITSDDDSVVTSAPLPENKDTAGEHDATKVLFGDTNPLSIDLTEKNGYIIIYSMAETNSSNGGASVVHHNKVETFGDYRQLLDQTRPKWRDGFGVGSIANFENGVYKNGILSPSIRVGGVDLTTTYYKWSDPTPTLTGSMRVMHEEDANAARDMILAAVPLNNFTDTNIMLWTEGETANLADRRLDDNKTLGANSQADYSEQNIANSKLAQDAAAFTTAGFYYTFNNTAGGNVANNLIVTQPLKRTLIQLGNLDNLWTGPAADSTFKTGAEYSFKLECRFWDNKENVFVAGGSNIITSPFNGAAGTTAINEVQIFGNADLEKGDVLGGTYDAIAGYAACGLGTAAPAIVTEMIGSDVGGTALTNWVYTTEQQ